jgi:endogenous inhibitor of DNA gyrase (YacG/DUF329 family)
MAKVIGRDEQAVKQVTCRACAARVEYTESEVKRYEGTDMSGGPDGRDWIVCPNCGKDITLRSW